MSFICSCTTVVPSETPGVTVVQHLHVDMHRMLWLLTLQKMLTCNHPAELGGCWYRQPIARVDQCTHKHSTTISRNLGLLSQKETQSGKDSCTSCLMHKTQSCVHTLNKDGVSWVRDVAEKVWWKKHFKGWTALMRFGEEQSNVTAKQTSRVC
jgi:hypothetical protein